jgi:S1-C subfamily serine protease
MIKSGMVGYQAGFTLESPALKLSGDVVYVDNALHSGASGGPVVDEKAEIVGILTERAITSVAFRETPDLRVPSGSNVAITPRVIKHLISSRTWL